MNKTISILFGMIVLGAIPFAYADSEKSDFAAYLEETLGHFWALEQNLDEGNAELALVHATHPIAELYDLMKPQLQSADPELDAQIQETLLDLQNQATTEVSREQAQMAIDDAKEIVQTARDTVVGQELSQDPDFKIGLIHGLIETSIAEYGEAVSDEMIEEMAEFQDGSAFVWRSQQIFEEIRDDIDSEEAQEIDELYDSLWGAYDERAGPEEVETIANAIIHELQDSQESKIDFAAYLEETLGHFWALEQNLDEGNAELALVHATHPIAELYDLMKPQLQSADPELDAQIQETLLDLQNQATTEVSREQAQMAIDDAKEIVQTARSAVTGDYLSNKTETKLVLMKGLLETSIAEYGEAVSDGMIEEMAEFQDGSAFVWRSQQIFEEIRDGIDSEEAQEIDELYDSLWGAYDERAGPEEVETLAGGIVHEIDEILGLEGEDSDLMMFVETIEELMEHTKEEYSMGNTDNALSLATKAYLDNYEFIEGPLAESGNEELMERVEIMIREDLRNMIRDNAFSSDVNTHIDAILAEMKSIEAILSKPIITEMEDEMNNTPYVQVENGVEPSEVICNEEMELLMKVSSEMPICVKPTSVERLVSLGFADHF